MPAAVGTAPRGTPPAMKPAALGLALLAALPAVASVPALRGGDLFHQVLVLDAGSSGTRIHVFNVLSTKDAGDRQHVPEIDLTVRGEQTLKIKPGLSSFAERGDLQGAEKNMRELLDFASQYVDANRRLYTPVLLKATAGLRAVKPEQAAAVFGRVRSTLASSGYRFRDEWAGIILGKEEGGLAWVAANYLQGTFRASAGGEPASTVGVIEMGGGSTQVSFKVEPGEEVAANDEFIFETALGHRFRLYAHSYLGYGLDHARARMKTLNEGAPQDPCFPHWYRFESFEGSGDAAQCAAGIETRLIGAALDAPGKYDAEVRLKVGNYIATGNFFLAQNDLSLDLEGRQVNSAELGSAAQTDCAKTVQSYPNTCFELSFQAVMLKALGAGEGGATVKIGHQIGGGDVDWALGAALVHYLQGDTAVGQNRFMELAMLLIAVLPVGLGGVRLLRRSFASQTVRDAGGMSPRKSGVTREAAETRPSLELALFGQAQVR